MALIPKQRVTNTQAKELALESEVIPTNWATIDYWQKVQILQKLNQELNRQRLPTVNEEVLHWRMAHILPPLLRARRQEDAGPKSNLDPLLNTSEAESSDAAMITLPPIRETYIAQHLDIQPGLAASNEERKTGQDALAEQQSG